MKDALIALLGAMVGFALPAIKDLITRRTIGNRFVNALEQELSDVKDRIHRKMLWVGRDVTHHKSGLDGRLLVNCGDRLLYLGEAEEFDVSLPFWEANTRDIVGALDTRSFNDICAEVVLIRSFIAKFKEMKMAFVVQGPNPGDMARACYQDLLRIHNELFSNHSINSVSGATSLSPHV